MYPAFLLEILRSPVIRPTWLKDILSQMEEAWISLFFPSDMHRGGSQGFAKDTLPAVMLSLCLSGSGLSISFRITGELSIMSHRLPSTRLTDSEPRSRAIHYIRR